MPEALEIDRILVDTDVLIDYSRGKSEILGTLLNKQSQGLVILFINPVIVAEFLTDNKLKDESKLKVALEFLNLFSVVEVTKKIGVITGELLRKGKLQFIGDALIAASCLVGDLKLTTRNKKHYSKVKNLVFTS